MVYMSMILVRIVQGINMVTKLPEIAMDEDRVQPHISPFLFKKFLPVSIMLFSPTSIHRRFTIPPM